MREENSPLKKREKYYNLGNMLFYHNNETNKIIIQTSPLIASFIGIIGTLLFCYVSKKIFL